LAVALAWASPIVIFVLIGWRLYTDVDGAFA
jgi:hypothetical protein